MPIYDGNSVRFGPGDYAPGSAQHAIAEAQSRGIGSTPAPSAAPTALQILAGDTATIRKYNERIENAWRNPAPQIVGGKLV